MFSKLALFVAAAFAASVFAVPSGGEYKCNVGKLQCCDQYQEPTSAKGLEITKGLANLPIGGLTGQLGAQCNPITAFGKGNGAGCASSPTCCDKVYQKQESLVGSVGINCSPATIIA